MPSMVEINDDVYDEPNLEARDRIIFDIRGTHAQLEPSREVLQGGQNFHQNLKYIYIIG